MTTIVIRNMTFVESMFLGNKNIRQPFDQIPPFLINVFFSKPNLFSYDI